jgi:diphthine-ammonia ligase
MTSDLRYPSYLCGEERLRSLNECRPRAAVSWSGGKDSCTALARAAAHYDVVAAVTMFDEERARSRSHGLRPELLSAQCERLGLRQVVAGCTWGSYNAAFSTALEELKGFGVTHVIFGDIMFDDHRRWAEDICAAAGMTAVEPIWGEPTSLMLQEFLAHGGEAMIVTVRAELLDHTWLGRTLSLELGDELARRGVDPCGERGEYHTLVIRTPLFNRPLEIRPAGHVLRSGCWALDVELFNESHGSARCAEGR